MIPSRFFNSSLSRDASKRTSQLCFSTDGGRIKDKNPPKISLCQINNHPNYRLKQAKARLASNNTKQSKTIKAVPKFTSPKKQEAPKKSIKYHKIIQQHGISIHSNENPKIRNDGTSSGAIVADRLRLARRKAIQGLSLPMEEKTNDADGGDSAQTITQQNIVKERGLEVIDCENPVRINDGTSSGAIVADRLRMARRKALESMRQPIDNNASAELNKDQLVKERGLDIVSYENPVRSNDGTSSGAVVADRLRMARMRAMDELLKSSTDSGGKTK